MLRHSLGVAGRARAMRDDRICVARDSKVLTMADAVVSAKKRSFDAAFKLMVVQYAEMSTNRGAATKYSVNEKQVSSDVQLN